MTILKQCADALRVHYRALSQNKLGAGHAHEIAAAYFGYPTAAALRADDEYPVEDIGVAAVIVPDKARMRARILELTGLPADLPDVNELARVISTLLRDEKLFTGSVWDADKPGDDVRDFVSENASKIEDELSGAMATTNAYFDEIEVDDVEIAFGDDGMMVNVSGSLFGEQDQDRAFHGDTIRFSSNMQFVRVAGRVGYGDPEIDTEGGVDDSMYYDEEPA